MSKEFHLGRRRCIADDEEKAACDEEAAAAASAIALLAGLEFFLVSHAFLFQKDARI